MDCRDIVWADDANKVVTVVDKLYGDQNNTMNLVHQGPYTVRIPEAFDTLLSFKEMIHWSREILLIDPVPLSESL